MIIGDIETTEKVEYEDLLKNYYEKMEIIKEQDKEIQDLKQKNDYLNDLEASAVEYKELKDQLQQKENIIKEVREYIKGACWLDEVNKPNSLGHKQTMKVLEILDKENI